MESSRLSRESRTGMEGENYQDYGTSTDSILNDPSLDSDMQKLESRTGRHFLLRFLPVIFFCLLFYCSVIGSFTIFPQYVLERMKYERNFSALLGNISLNPCFVNKSDHVYQIYLDIQQKSSSFLAAVSFAGGIPSLVSVAIFGALSDKLGRKKIVYISYAGLLVLNIGLSFVVNLDLPYWICILLTFLNGCCGSHGTMLAAIFAHVADVTDERQRPLVLAVVEFSLGVSMIIINIALGAVIKAVGFRAPMIGLAVLSVLSIFFMTCVKETAPNMGDTMSTCQVIRTPFARIKILLLQNRRRAASIILLTAALMLYSLILTSGLGVSTLYLMGIPFCWNSVVLGFFNAIKVFGFMIFSFLIVVFLRHRINNDNLILVGMVSFFSGSIVQGMASGFNKPGSDILMIISIGAGIFTSIPAVFIRSQASNLVRADEQGAVFGLMSTGETIAFSFGSTIANAMYAASVSFLAGLVFYFSAALIFISFVLIVIYKFVSAPLRLSLTYSVNAVRE